MMMLSIFFGSIVGISLGLTGGGGAVFAVPLLAYGIGVPAREAVGISLVAVGLTSLVGFLKKWRQGEAEIRTGLLFAVAGMLGAPVGNWIAGQLPETLLMLLFSGLMLTIAAKMWLQSRRSASVELIRCADDIPLPTKRSMSQTDKVDGPSCQRDATGKLILTSRCARLLLLVGVGSGVLSGMFGVGGGSIIVPSLVLFSGMSLSHAVGTSLMVIALISSSGLASLLWTGQEISLQITSLFVVGGIAGLFLGQSVSRHLSTTALQRVFSVAILIVAVFVMIRNLSQG